MRVLAGGLLAEWSAMPATAVKEAQPAGTARGDVPATTPAATRYRAAQ
jgi:hypothetical protein